MKLSEKELKKYIDAYEILKNMDKIDNLERRKNMSYIEKYNELVSVLYEAGDMSGLKHVEEYVENIRDYVKLIFLISLRTPIIETKFKSEVAEQAISDLEELKKRNLQTVVDACDYLNVTCRVYGLEPFCPNWNDEKGCAEFAGKFVAEMFKAGVRERQH